MVQSKNKGNTFERKIAKALSARFENHTGLSDSFRRNIDSGSFFGGKNKSRTQTYDMDKATLGDLVCPTEFRFTVECKHYKTPPTFASLLKQENRTFDDWIGQARQDAEGSQRHALIVVKFNNVPEFAMVEKTVWGDVAPLSYGEFVIIPFDHFLSRDESFFFASPDSGVVE